MQLSVNFTIGVLVIMVLLVLQSNYSIALAQNDLENNKWLSNQISDLEKLKVSSSNRISTYQTELKKCESTIKKSQDIINLAQQKNNRQAETVANDALLKAYDAKKKNQELLEFEKFNYSLIEKKISEFKLLLLELEVMETGGKNECDKLIVQFERDKRALKNFMKTIKMTDNERDVWTEEGKDAMKEAGMTLVKFFTAELADHITKREGKILFIKKTIDKYKKDNASDVIKNKYLLDQMDKKLMKAKELFTKITVQKTTEYTLASDNMIDIIKSDVELSESLMGNGDKEVMEVLNDNEVRLKLSEIGSSLADLLLEYESDIRASTKFFKTFSPLLSALPLVRDLSYAGTKLYLSSERVAQLSEVAEQEIKAVNSLKKQIERTNEKLKDCKKKTKK